MRMRPESYLRLTDRLKSLLQGHHLFLQRCVVAGLHILCPLAHHLRSTVHSQQRTDSGRAKQKMRPVKVFNWRTFC